MSRRAADRLFRFSLRSAALAAALALVFVTFFVGYEALPALQAAGAGAFLTDPSWHPASGTFGLMPMVLGSLAVSLLALVLAAPLGLGAALFENFYAPPVVRGLFQRAVELLAGIPSVVYGLWGLVVLVPLIAKHLAAPGTSILAAGLVLAIMILPTMALFSSAALGAIPAEQYRAASALGLSKWTALRTVLLPAAGRGIMTGLFLSFARALGETMAVLMVAGNVPQLPSSLLDPVRTLTANIALEMAYATGTHRHALFFSGFLVMAVTLLLVTLAGRSERKEARA